jgi:hypothetical protein
MIGLLGMIPFIGPALAAGGWWKALVGALVVAPAVFLLGQCSGAKNESNKTRAASAVAVSAAVTKNDAAHETSSSERAADTKVVTQLTQELTNAVASVPDTLPDPVAVRLGCERLRHNGRDTSKLPQCSGPAGGAQAPAH